MSDVEVTWRPRAGVVVVRHEHASVWLDVAQARRLRTLLDAVLVTDDDVEALARSAGVLRG